MTAITLSIRLIHLSEKVNSVRLYSRLGHSMSSMVVVDPITDATRSCVWRVIATDADAVPQFGQSSLRYYMIGDAIARKYAAYIISIGDL